MVLWLFQYGWVQLWLWLSFSHLVGVPWMVSQLSSLDFWLVACFGSIVTFTSCGMVLYEVRLLEDCIIWILSVPVFRYQCLFWWWRLLLGAWYCCLASCVNLLCACLIFQRFAALNSRRLLSHCSPRAICVCEKKTVRPTSFGLQRNSANPLFVTR